MNLLKALVDVQHDPNVGSIFTVSPEATIVGFVYLKPILRPEVFSSFYSVPSVATLIPATLATHGQIVNAVDSLLDPSLKAKYESRVFFGILIPCVIVVERLTLPIDTMR